MNLYNIFQAAAAVLAFIGTVLMIYASAKKIKTDPLEPWQRAASILTNDVDYLKIEAHRKFTIHIIRKCIVYILGA